MTLPSPSFGWSTATAQSLSYGAGSERSCAFNVSISPDGRYIATNGHPPRLTVWDAATFRQVAVPLPVDVGTFQTRARFAPDGRLVATSGTVLRAFTIDPAAWLARACQEAGRTLTRDEFEEVLPGQPYRPACA